MVKAPIKPPKKVQSWNPTGIKAKPGTPEYSREYYARYENDRYGTQKKKQRKK